MSSRNRISPRERVEAALLGGQPDMVPFTHYDTLFPRCAVERQLRNDGLCIVQRRPSVFTVDSPHVSREEVHFSGRDGRARIRTSIHTPDGTLSAVRISMPIGDRPMDQVMSWTSWHEEYLFKGPPDYERLEFMIQDRRYSPNYEVFQAQADLMGEDVIMRAQIPYEPLQEIIIEFMGIAQFAVEWAERRERVMRLHNIMVEDRRKIYPLVAKSPALIANYGGNVTPEIVGRARFEQLIVPCYNEAAEVLHAHGKLLGVHFDANVKAFAPAIARSKLDYIEAFSPYPSSDMTLAEARAAWPDKILWINFPSAVHLEPLPAIEAMTRQLLREAAPGHRFLIGITEDVPADRWQDSLCAIMRVIREDGRLPIS
jgi:hypothetical protein